jgi:hypothetical protein
VYAGQERDTCGGPSGPSGGALMLIRFGLDMRLPRHVFYFALLLAALLGLA